MKSIKIFYSNSCYYVLYTLILLYASTCKAVYRALLFLGLLSIKEERRLVEDAYIKSYGWFSKAYDKLVFWIIVR